MKRIPLAKYCASKLLLEGSENFKEVFCLVVGFFAMWLLVVANNKSKHLESIMMENFFPDIISLSAAVAAPISGKDGQQMSLSTHQADNEIQEPDSCTCKQQRECNYYLLYVKHKAFGLTRYLLPALH